MSQQQQQQDEMTSKLAEIYAKIVAFNKLPHCPDIFTQDELSLIRWAFGITKN